MSMRRWCGARVTVSGLALGVFGACSSTPTTTDADSGAASSAHSTELMGDDAISSTAAPEPPAPPTAPPPSSSGGPDDGSHAPAPKPGCKRGIAANVAPSAAFAPAVKWWYNWAIDGETPAGIEFVPMIWGASSVGKAVPGGAKFVLGFNEPNFFEQANLSPEDAANLWPEVENSAGGLPIVGPGMNFCGPAERCHGTNPYEYLDQFFASCEGCRVDYVAVHWYNCDLPSLRDYLEPGNGLDGFEQYGVPIWLTEFSCNPSASVEEQEAFMREAIPYLESNPHVFRYSWFSAGPIPNAKLINDDGSPTALGQVYIDLEQAECE